MFLKTSTVIARSKPKDPPPQPHSGGSMSPILIFMFTAGVQGAPNNRAAIQGCEVDRRERDRRLRV